MLTLGIETTCDETGIALVAGTKEILSNQIASQVEVHSVFGGVIPELASRMHTEMFVPLLDRALKDAKVALKDIDLIGVANGPGLLGALIVGLQSAKALSLALNKPLMGINHVEAHLYGAYMSHEEEITFPAIGVILSGGHTALLYMESLGKYRLIGQTVDDAMGEAFDKVAKMMHLPYPGGPEIEKRAIEGNSSRYPLKAGHIKGRPYDFSFSGMKTAVLYTLFGQEGSIERGDLPTTTINDMAASFQNAAIKDVVKKVAAAADEYRCTSIILGGGVTNNRALKNEIKALPFRSYWPSPTLTLDNGAMIAGLAAWKYLNGYPASGLELQPLTRIPFC